MKPREDMKPNDGRNPEQENRHRLPELFFSMVRAIGTDVTAVTSEIESLLGNVRCRIEQIQLSKLFHRVPFLAGTLKDSPEDLRYRTHMNAGDLLRSATKRGDAAAVLGIEEIERQRDRLVKGEVSSKAERGRAYLLKSLMHPAEVATLRRIYGSQLFVLSVFAPRDIRHRRLARKIAESHGQGEDVWSPVAEELMNRDVGIIGEKEDIPSPIKPTFFLDVQKTFERADLFISATAPDESQEAVRRLVELIFGHPFHTPSREEFGMSIAYSASLRSSSLGRPVGAAILTPEGDVVAVGTNEVPRFGGGQYWPGDQPDGRNFQLGYDSSDRIRRQVLADLLRRFSDDRSWITSSKRISAVDLEIFERVLNELTLDRTIERALSSDTISKARLLDVIEYGREVHAEMAAITDAAQRGVPVRGCVLYCTTFPCHECARHIVSAGIRRVVYIEAYPKSRVAELYEDSIGLADRRTDLGNRVRFEPFVGVAPRRYQDLFSWVPRKAADAEEKPQNYTGEVVNWSLGDGVLRDSIADVESLESGARVKAITSSEGYAVRAFKHRLSETERVYSARKQT
jgi:cytidine deaminase